MLSLTLFYRKGLPFLNEHGLFVISIYTNYFTLSLDMHTLFMFLKDQLNITLFIVGDAKQAIYLWRGAQSNIFEMLKQDDMNHYSLIKNFRCHDEIVNYANLIHNSRYFNNDYTVPVSRLVHCKTDDFISSFTRMVENNIINIQEEITRSEEHTSELQSRFDLVCRLLLEK